MAIRGKYLRNKIFSALIVVIATIGFSAGVWAAACAPKKLSQAEVDEAIKVLADHMRLNAVESGFE